MKRLYKNFVFALLAFLAFSCQSQKEEQKPNIIYILADDLGYGELGVYGQEKIQTPNIDALAGEGMLFTQHYSGAPVCAPARYMLMTGKHAGHARIRGNDEWKERGDVWDFEKAVNDPNLEGQRPILNSTVTLGEVMHNAGYKTGVVGKWGLGAPLTEGIPTKNGFDFFYGYNCQRQAHQLYPKHLWKNEEKVWLNNDIIAPNTKLDEGADIKDLASYKKYDQVDYAPALMQKEVINFIEENKDSPFFMYYATPIPHLPLQVPHEYVAKYLKLFGEEEPYVGNRGYFPNRYPNAAYAGMISYLDDQVGEIVQKLKDLDLYDNTIIVFTSDNGPTYLGGVDAEYFNSARPFSNDYGRTKGFTHEGGIRVPMIVSWPGKIEAGSKSDHVSAFWDVMPTFGELVKQGVPEDIDGLSFLPTLLGEKNQKNHEFLYWEFPAYQGQQAVRMGDWKGIRKNIFKGNMKLELYDLSKDPVELNDVADANPDIVKKIESIMKSEHTPAEIERFKIKQLGD
ncbi:arylsulfatase [Urechidicola vernalis]|uniref:Arylsulfatase n=1 Tax=Urechidicola vernalis TaxID=3075600 RepID=A0ABU2Y4F5_9FLAO|nr:arylsulfatase [Urechidicola sp. P050]MDT0552675.1 arylsulfatase [Urechidicola sp. P050]